MHSLRSALVPLGILLLAGSIENRAVAQTATSNLIRNGGAEEGATDTTCTRAASAIPGWQLTGPVAVCTYSGASIEASAPGPPDRANSFLSGGPSNAVSSMLQTVSLSAYSTAIDQGTYPYTVSAWLGGWSSQDDQAQLKLAFKSASGATLAGVQLGPVLASQRSNVSALLLKTASGVVPAGARSAEVQVTFTRTSGDWNDGAADSISLVLGSAATGPANLALGATVSASSFYEAGYAPSMAVDGDLTTDWAAPRSATAGAPEWLLVDLGRVVSLAQIVLVSRDNPQYDASYWETYNLYTSQTTTFGAPVASGKLCDASAGDCVYSNTVAMNGTAVRYIKFEVTGGTHWAHLHELQAFTGSTGTCSYSINPQSAQVAASAGSGVVNVTTGSGCTWSATTNATWLTISTGANSAGSGVAGYNFTGNATTATRSGTLTIAGYTFTVTQAAATASCSYAISPTSATAPASGATGSVTVTTTAGCDWRASSNATWLTITSGTSGSGNGIVNYTAAANSGSTSRTAALSIEGRTFTLTQSAAVPSCSYALAPTSAQAPESGVSGSVSVTTAASCGWSASSSATWLTIVSGRTGTGNGTIQYTVAANGSSSARTATLTVDTQTFTLTQAAAGNTSPAGGEELSVDDGVSETAMYGDGYMVVNRLTPPRYPAKLKSIKLIFERWTGFADPTGKAVRLIAFTSSGAAPPNRPQLAINQSITIQRTGEFMEFPVDGPQIESGDFYVGFQAPTPFAGVMFSVDTSTVAKRSFMSADGVAYGALAFGDSATGNALIRAVVTMPSEEVSVDDGTAEQWGRLDGGIVVNRLTPGFYPARLSSIRIYFGGVDAATNPVGRQIRLVAFSDAAGTGKPAANSRFAVDTHVTVSSSGEFVSFPVDGPTVNSGDLYVGYQSPPEGSPPVLFAADNTGRQYAAGFFSADNGASWQGPLVLGDQKTPVNMMIRGIFSRGGDTVPAGDAAFALKAALEAQARGDVTELMKSMATEDFGTEEVDGMRQAFEAVRDAWQVRNFVFTPRATLDTIQGTKAMVRGEVDYDVDGNHITHGIAAYLVRRNGQWKISAFAGDEMRDMEIRQRQAAASGVKRSNGARGAQMADFAKINAVFDHEISWQHVDESGLKWDAAQSAGGLAGQGTQWRWLKGAMAVWDTVEAVQSSTDAFDALAKYGICRVSFVKGAVAAVGVAQVFADPIPGAAQLVDILKTGLKQIAYNEGLYRTLLDLKMMMTSLDADVKFNPAFYSIDGWTYPKGAVFHKSDDLAPSFHNRLNGSPLNSISFDDPGAALDQTIPLYLIGELVVNPGFNADLITAVEKYQSELGAGKYISFWYVPVNLSNRIYQFETHNDEVVTNLGRDRANNVVTMKVTCQRGHESFRAQLNQIHVDEFTGYVAVDNSGMNAIRELQLPGINDPLILQPGEMRSLRVIGATNTAGITADITGRPECLSVSSSKPAIAAATAPDHNPIRLDAKAEGEATVQFVLSGSRNTGSPADLSRNLTALVEKSNYDLSFLTSKNWKVDAVVSGISKETGTDRNTILQQAYENDAAMVMWSNTTFTVSHAYRELTVGATGTFTIEDTITGGGSVTPDGARATCNLKSTYTVTSAYKDGPTVVETRTTEIVAHDIPIVPISEENDRSIAVGYWSQDGTTAGLVDKAVETHTITGGGAPPVNEVITIATAKIASLGFRKR